MSIEASSWRWRRPRGLHKGILERFRGLERFFELNPLPAAFHFVQIGAPAARTSSATRISWPKSAGSERVNSRFQTSRWKPSCSSGNIIPRRDRALFPRRFFCMVTSLHDGMNSSPRNSLLRASERGTYPQHFRCGRELSDALLVNPRRLAIADSIHRALEMSEEEQSTRMHACVNVREHNITAGRSFLSDLTNSHRYSEREDDLNFMSTSGHSAGMRSLR